MESRTRSTSPLLANVEVKQEELTSPPNKISAYYSLVFPHFTFYIQTLSVTIGRRCIPNSSSSSSSAPEPTQVDVDLGALKSVSRLHAKIEYDADEDRFMLVVIGRNGAWVDGVWQGSGTKAPLGERSQIQIASRTFHFVLPPPPPPEDTPSPSSHSSTNRQRSPSLDITSISPPSSQPSHSPPPREPKPPTPPPEPQLGNSNAIARSTKANAKKRKKSETTEVGVSTTPVKERPRPEEIPPKPTLTYAQLIYRAIKAHDGKATLQEICTWIMNEFDYYRYTEGSAWMSSVRHNLSSGRAFKKMERCGGDRGKGFFWSLDEVHQHTLEEQDMKSQLAAADGPSGKGRRRDKGAPLSEPPLKRSVKGDIKGGVLPPPLTSTPLAMKTTPSTVSAAVKSQAAHAPTGVFAYAHHPMMAAATVTSSYSGTPLSAPNPYAALTQQWQIQSKAATATPAPNSSTTTTNSTISSSTSNLATVSAPSASSSAVVYTSTTTSAPASSTSQTAVPDVAIPIVLGPIPSTHQNYSPTHPNNSAKEGYMILHERRLILDPDVFSGLTKDMLTELERMGARQAIEVLTGHMVRVLKERRKSRKSARGRGRGSKGPGGLGRKATAPTAPSGPNEPSITGPSSGPFTTTPLPSRSACATVSTPMSADAKPSPAQNAPTFPTPNAVVDDADFPINILDSDDEGPATKKRKVGDLSTAASSTPAPPLMASLLS